MQTLLITVDALRADHLGQYNYDRATMPALDRLVDAGTLFENAFSNGPYTRVSIPSIHTSHHLAYDAIDEFPTIASFLSNAGVETAAIGTQTGIDLLGSGFGFDETIDLGRDNFHERANADRSLAERVQHRINRPATKLSRFLQQKGADRLYTLLKAPYNALVEDDGFQYLGYTSAERVTDRTLQWLESNADTDFFLWVHYMEAHRPYGVHERNPEYLDSHVDEDRIKQLMKKAGVRPEDVSAQERRLMRDLYDSDLRYCSRHLDRLFDGLEELGLWDGASILFSSDHGEEFHEHGEFFHRNYPYEELMHVPLVVKTPRVDAAGRITEVRELLDLAPTIASFHAPDSSHPDFTGEHLFEGDSRTVFSLGQPNDTPPAVTLRTDRWKLIADERRVRLFDLVNDPDERTDVGEEHPSIARRLRERIPDTLLAREANPPRSPNDDVDREQLEALGYMELRK